MGARGPVLEQVMTQQGREPAVLTRSQVLLMQLIQGYTWKGKVTVQASEGSPVSLLQRHPGSKTSADGNLPTATKFQEASSL